MNNENINNKYIVYKNDLKYKKNRELDETKIIWSSLKVKNLYHDIDLDSLQYRIDECIEENLNSIDLKYLNLEKIPELPDKIIKSLKYLFLGDNIITELTDLNKLINLEILELNHNKIKTISNLPQSLIELCIKDNLLENINFDKKCKIERLDVRQNKIKNIDIPQSIIILDIAQNKLNMSINGLYNIEKILCGHNYINEINNCPNLNYLDCRSNPIININNCINIEHLICSNTLLKNIPYCPNIKTIECFYTQIYELPYYNNLCEILCEKEQIKRISSKYTVNSAEIYKNTLIYIIFTPNLN
jgi:Leucine-rich repeat (LRR) protein